MSASHRKSTQVHASPGQTGSQVDASSQLASTFGSEFSNLSLDFLYSQAMQIFVGAAQLPPFSLIRDFGKQNTRGNVSKISVNHTCYRHVGSKSTNHSKLA